MNLGFCRTGLYAGNRNCSVASFSAGCSAVLIHFASSAAAIGFFVPARTASVDPPQLAETLAPCSHWGMVVARHLPEVLPAVPYRKTGPHAAVCHEAYLPLARPWYHWSVKSGSTETRSSWIRVFHRSTTLVTSGLSRSIVTVSAPS